MTAAGGASGPRSRAPEGPVEDWSREAQRAIGLLEAIAIARRSVEHLSALRFDSIARSERAEGGGWRIVVDVIESKARMGSNDLISSFEVMLAPDGELLGYNRLHRYNRESGTPA